MTENELVILTQEKVPLLIIEPHKSIVTPVWKELKKQETVKARLECPRCCWIFEVPQPDSKHVKPTYNKEAVGSVVEEPRVCRNPKCKKQFTIYWHSKTPETI